VVEAAIPPVITPVDPISLVAPLIAVDVLSMFSHRKTVMLKEIHSSVKEEIDAHLKP
jgi:hypothetical protein